jgi:hypothetical protein
MTSIDARQEGGSAQDPSERTMAPWMFNIKFPHGTQFTFGSLMFHAGEDGDLRMRPPEPAPEHPALALSSALGGSCSGSDPCAALYILVCQSIEFISLGIDPDHNSSDDYPEIGTSTCGKPVEDGCLIFIVAPNGDQSHYSSSRYPTIRRLEASNARTPSLCLVQNLNLNFNVVRVQGIMGTIQRMAPDGSPLAVSTQ